MKFSIDYDASGKTMSGWATSEGHGGLDDCTVHLERFLQPVISTGLSLHRPDVQRLGLHPTGWCGFSFDLGHIACVAGDFICIRIESADEAVRRIFLLGDSKQNFEQFDKLEYVRDDFDVMRDSTAEVLRAHSNLMALKVLLVRLRRAKRARGWRGKFEGYPHEHLEQDWAMFGALVRFGYWSLFDCISTRYLWSVIDTFADYADAHERLAALSLSSILMHERFAQTRKVVMEMNPRPAPQVHKQAMYWGGMATNRLVLDDSLDVFLTRAIESLQPYPLIYSFFIEIIIRMMDAQDSSVGMNIKNSEYFQQAVIYYRHRFASEKSVLMKHDSKTVRESLA